MAVLGVATWANLYRTHTIPIYVDTQIFTEGHKISLGRSYHMVRGRRFHRCKYKVSLAGFTGGKLRVFSHHRSSRDRSYRTRLIFDSVIREKPTRPTSSSSLIHRFSMRDRTRSVARCLGLRPRSSST